ncbi:MAG: DUF2062 domain-containing protein [Acidobacteria bacterium]|nr:DUF2062 domain-containing protein [Acidobacteriota bacterium]
MPPRVRRKMRRLVVRLRLEGRTPARRAAAIGIGLFIGLTPLYGVHFFMSLGAARLFGISRVWTYLATQVSQPYTVPFIFAAEIEAGSLLTRGSLLPARNLLARPWHYAPELALGSLVLGLLFGAVAMACAYPLLRRRDAARRRAAQKPREAT